MGGVIYGKGICGTDDGLCKIVSKAGKKIGESFRHGR